MKFASLSTRRRFRTLILSLVSGVVLLPMAMRAEIATYVDPSGRRVYVNSEDRELRRAAQRGGATAALRLIGRRRLSLPGMEGYIAELARAQAIDPRLVQAVIEVESAWNPRARSPKGALGLMQLMPQTAARLGVHDPFDPRENVAGGIRHLRSLLDKFRGDLSLALAAYNAGENVVSARGGIPPYRETQDYVKRISSLYGDLSATNSFISGISRTITRVEENGRVTFVNY